jgi:hypothetical protein
MKKMMLERLPVELHRQFKAACYQQGKTMREVIIRMMQEYVKGHNG